MRLLREEIIMESKRIFLVLFIFSLILFFVSLFVGFASGYTIALHISLLSIALMFLFKSTLAEFFKEIGFPGSIKEIVIYTFAGLVSIVLLLIILSAIFNFLQINDQQNIVDIAQSLPLYLLAFAIVIAPITEELFFRAFLSKKVGIIISSIIFGLFHYSYGSVMEIVGAFVIGACLAYIYKRSGSITPIILIHMIYNAASIIIMRFLI